MSVIPFTGLIDITGSPSIHYNQVYQNSMYIHRTGKFNMINVISDKNGDNLIVISCASVKFKSSESLVGF